MSKTIDLMGFYGYDFEASSITAQKINVVQSMVVLDVFGNVKIGQDAGLFLTNGRNNIAFGTNAGKYLTTGHDNIVLGTNSGYKINTSYENVVIGMDAAYNLTSGTRNCLYGYRCGYSMNRCEYNTLLGNYCGGALINTIDDNEYEFKSDKNVMLGYECGRYADSVVESVYVGQRAGAYMNGASNVAVGLLSGAGDAGVNVNAYQTVFVGFGAGTYILDGIVDAVCLGTSAGEFMDAASYAVYAGSLCGRYAKGNFNVYIGTECGYDINYSANNTGIGYACLWNGGGNGFNVAIGSQCLWSLLDATRCVAIGYNTASSIASGYNIVALGTEALTNPTTGIDQIAIGYRASYRNAGSTNIAIGTSTLGNETEDVTGSYNVCLGPYAAMNLTSGDSNVISGYQACMEGGATSASVIYGFQAMDHGGANRAVALGYQAARYNKGDDNIALGTSALGGENDADTGLARSADATHIQLKLGAVNEDEYYKYLYVTIIAGTGVGQVRQITAYVGATRTATIDPNWSIIPDTSSQYVITNNWIASGTCPASPASTSSTIAMDPGSSSRTNRYVACYCVLVGGTGVGQVRFVTAYNTGTKVATVTPNWSVVPNNTTQYQMYATGVCGYNLISLGSYSGLRITDNYDSIYVGTAAGYFGGGYENIAIGVSSMYYLVQGTHNICVGKESALSLKNGDTNCIVGYKAGRNMGDSAFLGKLPAGLIDTNSGNVLYGYEAGYNLCGPMNLCVGTQAGYSEPLGIGLTEAAGNIMIGFHGPFYRTNTSNPGIYTKGVGQLVIGNSLTLPPSYIPPIILGTMPYANTGDPIYPGQTAQFVINCLNSDGVTTGEIIHLGLVAKVGGLTDVSPGAALTALQLRNNIITVTNMPAGGAASVTLPSAADIAGLFPNPYAFNPWPTPGMQFDVTIAYVAPTGTLTINAVGGSGVAVLVGNNVVPATLARTLKFYFTSSTTVTAIVC